MARIFKLLLGKVKALHQKYGWKAVAGLFLYYLVRDVTLYVILPFYAFSALK